MLIANFRKIENNINLVSESIIFIMKQEVVDIQNVSGTQTIELPDGFKIDDDKVYLKKTGNIISLIPYHSGWKNFYESLSAFTSDFMNDREQPSQQSRKILD